MNKLSKILEFIGSTIGANPSTLTTSSKNLVGAVNELKAGAVSILDIYPVGSYYETSKSQAEFDPNVAWGGTWVLDSQGRVTVSMNSSETEFDTLGETGGAKTASTGNHTLTTSQIPAHTHGSKSLTGYFNSRKWVGNNGTGHIHPYASGIASVSSVTMSGYGVATSSSDPNSQDRITINATHEHSSVGGGGAHNHGSVSTVQPYVVVNRWHRTA